MLKISDYYSSAATFRASNDCSTAHRPTVGMYPTELYSEKILRIHKTTFVKTCLSTG